MTALPAFQTIGVIGRYRGLTNVDTLRVLIDFLMARGCHVVLETDTAKTLDNTTLPTATRALLSASVDLMIVVGGDGSLLSAARHAVLDDTPVVGINRGKVGFLADVKPDELEERLDDILRGNYTEEKRFLLHMTLHYKGKILAEYDALNDVVVMPGDVPHMIEFDTYINDQFMCSQQADGIIVTTPTGSTAYALSGGGPILHPQLDAIALVPVFPHKLSSRPIVLNGSSRVKIQIHAQNDSTPKVSCDSQEREDIPPGGHIEIIKKPQTLRLIHPLSYHYFETLRTKLGWEEQ